MTDTGRTRIRRLIACFAVLFGIITLFAGGSVALGDASARQAAGNIVEFVVWFNFCAGFAYILAGVGLWLNQRWAPALAAGIALATILILGLFVWHISQGNSYEPRTAAALVLRATVWLAIAKASWPTAKTNPRQ